MSLSLQKELTTTKRTLKSLQACQILGPRLDAPTSRYVFMSALLLLESLSHFIRQTKHKQHRSKIQDGDKRCKKERVKNAESPGNFVVKILKYVCQRSSHAHEQQYRKLNISKITVLKEVFVFKQSCRGLVAKNIKQRHASSFLVFP
jgi:hypothetical protein